MKPRLRYFGAVSYGQLHQPAFWLCYTSDRKGYGTTPRRAYSDWQYRGPRAIAASRENA